VEGLAPFCSVAHETGERRCQRPAMRPIAFTGKAESGSGGWYGARRGELPAPPDRVWKLSDRVAWRPRGAFGRGACGSTEVVLCPRARNVLRNGGFGDKGEGGKGEDKEEGRRQGRENLLDLHFDRSRGGADEPRQRWSQGLAPRRVHLRNGCFFCPPGGAAEEKLELVSP
jgi:hypothetical protein